MINIFWLKIFILVFWCLVGLSIGIDVRYYSKHFKRGRNG